jgi:hypothetical protein
MNHFLLDSNILIEYLSGNDRIVSYLDSISKDRDRYLFAYPIFHFHHLVLTS